MKKNKEESKNKNKSQAKTIDHGDSIFYKFPRTSHLFAVGSGSSVGRDDLLISKNDQNEWYSCENLILEEKIDGANLGISMDSKTFEIKTQNRSHYVSKSSAIQFKTLDVWINERSKELYKVLGGGRYILFGEWVYAKHSIFYDRIPDYFIAFDIFDSKHEKFLSVDRRNRRLEGSGIPVIREVARGKFSFNELLKIVEGEVTIYCKERSPIEGLYLRMDGKKFNKKRCKIVNDGFIQTIEDDGHWSKKKLIVNKIDYELKYK